MPSVLPFVTFIDAMHNQGARIGEPQITQNSPRREGHQWVSPAWIHQEYQVDIRILQCMAHCVTSRTQRGDERNDETVAAAPRAILNPETNGDLHRISGETPPSSTPELRTFSSAMQIPEGFG